MEFQFNILTLFPEIFDSFLSQSLVKKALDKNIIKVDLINYRKYGLGKHLVVDDTPYGGGAGMVLKPDPLVKAIEEVETSALNHKTHKILITPQGKPFSQKKAAEISRLTVPVTLICGKYEGFDERIRTFVDEEISIGDYILQGGEIASMVILEAVSRLVPGCIGNQDSLSHESFSDGLLEYAQYTKPADFRGLKVPEVLLSGNHKKIEAWRKRNAIEKTMERRPELFKDFNARSKNNPLTKVEENE